MHGGELLAGFAREGADGGVVDPSGNGLVLLLLHLIDLLLLAGQVAAVFDVDLGAFAHVERQIGLGQEFVAGDAAATEVTDFGRRITMGQLEQIAIQRVGFKYKGVGRLVYPGMLQLQSFISMNSERHSKAFSEQIMRVARGEASDHDAHNRFYDESLAVMDMSAEFYLSTVERIFKNREIARNVFVVAGKPVDLAAIKRVAVMTVEGEKDDISAPGQCVAALSMLPGLPEAMKTQHLEPGAGHYGIFAGKSWRLNIRPLVLGFIDKHSDLAPDAVVRTLRRPKSV